MTTFVMKPESEIILDTPPEKDSKIKLISGNIWENVKKMLKDGSMEVEMSQAICGARGTIFVSEETGTLSTLKVIEGQMKFTHKITGESITVNAGKMAVADASGISELKNFDIATEKSLWEKIISASQEKPPVAEPTVGIVMVISIILIVYMLIRKTG